MSNPQRPHGLQPTRLLCPWDFPGKSTGVGCHCLFQVTLASKNKLGSVPSSLIFWKCLYHFFFGRFHQGSSLKWRSFMGRFFMTNSTFLIDTEVFRLSISPGGRFGSWCTMRPCENLDRGRTGEWKNEGQAGDCVERLIRYISGQKCGIALDLPGGAGSKEPTCWCRRH